MKLMAKYIIVLLKDVCSSDWSKDDVTFGSFVYNFFDGFSCVVSFDVCL